MKVSNTTPNLVNKTYGNTQNRSVAENSGKVEKPGEEAGVSDNVSLSDRTKDIRKAEAAMDSPPAERAERVADIKKRVEEGTYKVNAEKVAEKMAGNFLHQII
ncbi:MAG: flagellar biosynthesis anti-sigma factor FlgM [Desulfobacteraceae bacterium]